MNKFKVKKTGKQTKLYAKQNKKCFCSVNYKLRLQLHYFSKGIIGSFSFTPENNNSIKDGTGRTKCPKKCIRCSVNIIHKVTRVNAGYCIVTYFLFNKGMKSRRTGKAR